MPLPPVLPVLRAFAIGAVCFVPLSAASLPAARPGPTRPINTDPKGPPIPATPPVESAHPEPVALWPNGAPGSEARKNEPEEISWRQEPDIVFPVVSNIHHPTITPFLPAKEKATGCAVIIAPGGGHMQHTIDREGYDLARWFADRGIAAFVLKYRLARDGSNPPGAPQPYQIDIHGGADGSRAIRVVRTHAAEWGIKPDRIGILGFSAGGEIALLAASRHTPGDPGAADPVERVSSRPDFFAPIYPGGLNRQDLAWSKEATPPAFLSCAYDDRMPEQLAAFFTRLRQAGVNAELHIYSSGGHGYGVRADRPDLAVSTWHARFVEWLGDRGFLKK
ncbi:MAG TPA: alpha/beta hydrolase [Lacunisphaera sp.]|nr:alpha/beta hydrolase [Lacunisphaera sp.]